jgi:DTW domain-containing protein
MTTEAFRALCLTCRRPKRVCWCDDVRRVESRTRVVFVQHPREAKVPISTCRMAHHALPNSELHVALMAKGVPALEAICQQEEVAVLFPSEGATQVENLATPPKTLIVVDGTWSNAKKVVEKCPLLSRLPRLAFTPQTPGNYRIRQEPTEKHYSTVEAVAYVLERLEGKPGAFRPMLNAFDAMVDRQLAFTQASGGQTRHRRKPKRNSVPVDLLAPLKQAQGNLVCVFAEANAWPDDSPSRPPGEAEMIQLVALRLASNERFSVLLAPQRPLSPSVSCHLDLPADVFATAAPRAEALAAWQRFVQPSDVLVGWGSYCASLLAQEGLKPTVFIDVRGLLAQQRKGRPGGVEQIASTLGVALPHGQGRAARRLLSLAEVCTASLDGRIEETKKHGR